MFSNHILLLISLFGRKNDLNCYTEMVRARSEGRENRLGGRFAVTISLLKRKHKISHYIDRGKKRKSIVLLLDLT